MCILDFLKIFFKNNDVPKNILNFACLPLVNTASGGRGSGGTLYKTQYVTKIGML
jgi:hypothetical protein